MIQIVFIKSEPVVTHRLLLDPLRIQRTDKAIRSREVIASCDTEETLLKLVYSIDSSLHVDYVLIFETGEQPLNRWLKAKLEEYHNLANVSRETL